MGIEVALERLAERVLLADLAHCPAHPVDVVRGRRVIVGGHPREEIPARGEAAAMGEDPLEPGAGA